MSWAPVCLSNFLRLSNLAGRISDRKEDTALFDFPRVSFRFVFGNAHSNQAPIRQPTAPPAMTQRWFLLASLYLFRVQRLWFPDCRGGKRIRRRKSFLPAIVFS